MDQLLMRLPQIANSQSPATVDKASRADAPALGRLLTAAFEQPWGEEWVVDNLFADPTVKATYVVRGGTDEIEATASARLLPDRFPDAGYVHFVATAPNARGRGLGVVTTLAVLESFASDGLRQAVLETDDERLSAIAMYLGLGFVPEYRDDSHVLRWSEIFRTLKASSARTEVRR